MRGTMRAFSRHVQEARSLPWTGGIPVADPEELLEDEEGKGVPCPCCLGKREHHFPDVRPHPVPCRACDGKGVLE